MALAGLVERGSHSDRHEAFGLIGEQRPMGQVASSHRFWSPFLSQGISLADRTGSAVVDRLIEGI